MSAASSAHPVSITSCPDGPLIVRGDLALFDDRGEPVVPNRRTFALCRCGASAIRPFCDGSHKLVGFRTTPPPRTASVTFDEPAPPNRMKETLVSDPEITPSEPEPEPAPNARRDGDRPRADDIPLPEEIPAGDETVAADTASGGPPEPAGETERS